MQDDIGTGQGPTWRTADSATDLEVPPQERTLGMLTHLSALAGLIVPFGSVLGPLVVWLIKKEESRFVDDQGKQALNFQLSMLILLFAVVVLVFMLTVVSMGLLAFPFVILGWLAAFGLALVALGFAVVGAIKANDGVWYRYPFGFTFFR